MISPAIPPSQTAPATRWRTSKRHHQRPWLRTPGVPLDREPGEGDETDEGNGHGPSALPAADERNEGDQCDAGDGGRHADRAAQRLRHELPVAEGVDATSEAGHPRRQADEQGADADDGRLAHQHGPRRGLAVTETGDEPGEPRHPDGEQRGAVGEGGQRRRPEAQRPRQVTVGRRHDRAGPSRRRRADVEHRGTGDPVGVLRDDLPGDRVRPVAEGRRQRDGHRVAGDGGIVGHDGTFVVEHPCRSTDQRDRLAVAQRHDVW